MSRRIITAAGYLCRPQRSIILDRVKIVSPLNIEHFESMDRCASSVCFSRNKTNTTDSSVNLAETPLAVEVQPFSKVKESKFRALQVVPLTDSLANSKRVYTSAWMRAFLSA